MAKTILFLVSIAMLLSKAHASTTATDQIAVNQLGYYTHQPKTAAVIAAGNNTVFYVISVPTHDTVYKGMLGKEIQSTNSSLKTKIADFGTLQTPGRYYVSVPGIGNSHAFTIGSNALRQAGVASLKGFYYQRASMPLAVEYAGKWHRGAGHPDTAVLIHASAASVQRPEGTVIASPGGWYDAGDYNKYIVNSGISMGTLLSAYEDFPDYFNTLRVNIPEQDGLPDLLNEVLYNLRWMLTMQDPHDGGVYHKCTNAGFDGMVMPGVTQLPRYAVQKGTAATLDFAAVTAQAARVFGQFDRQLPGLSDSCLRAAEKAWQWTTANPHVEYDQDKLNLHSKPPITTGAYGDKKFSDEFFWAASELFATTGKETYRQVVLQYSDAAMGVPTWSNVQLLGYYTLLRVQGRLPEQTEATIKKRLVEYADRYVQQVPRSAFATAMGLSSNDFVWGSSAVAANQGILLLNAYLLTKDQKYLTAALSSADHVLGRNATGYCFVTGIGSKSPMHPHHRPSVADGVVEPVPGLLVGGPNPRMEDKCTYYSFEPETTYTDLDCSYASNEIAINWNAPLVYLVNALEVLCD